MKKRTSLLLICLLLLILSSYANAEGFTITDTQTETSFFEEQTELLITATGDVTFGGNMKDNPASTIYTRALEAHGGDLSYFFANVYDIFSSDDLTLINFEGTLTNVSRPAKNNTFCFRADPSHVLALSLSSVEAVALENNHVQDFGETGFQDTVNALEGQGIIWSSDGHIGEYTVNGTRIAMLAYQTFNGAYPDLSERVPLEVAAAKQTHDLVIVSYHWGTEKDYLPNDKQIKLGRLTIDSGADLVLGHHSHRINPIEYYNGHYIVYSLGNCAFSGNSRPDDMDTFIFQMKFNIENGQAQTGAFRIIPCSISSVTGLSGKQSGENDFAVTPFAEGSDAAKRVLDKLMKNGKKLEYAVSEYPTQW